MGEPTIDELLFHLKMTARGVHSPLTNTRYSSENTVGYDHIKDAFTELEKAREQIADINKEKCSLRVIQEDTEKVLRDVMFSLRMSQGLQKNGLPYPAYHEAHDFLVGLGGWQEFKTLKQIEEE